MVVPCCLHSASLGSPMNCSVISVNMRAPLESLIFSISLTCRDGGGAWWVNAAVHASAARYEVFVRNYPVTLPNSKLSCFPEPWYPPWERKSLTCSWTCSSSRCQQFSSSTLAPAVGSGAPAPNKVNESAKPLQETKWSWFSFISFTRFRGLKKYWSKSSNVVEVVKLLCRIMYIIIPLGYN